MIYECQFAQILLLFYSSHEVISFYKNFQITFSYEAITYQKVPEIVIKEFSKTYVNQFFILYLTMNYKTSLCFHSFIHFQNQGQLEIASVSLFDQIIHSILIF